MTYRNIQQFEDYIVGSTIRQCAIADSKVSEPIIIENFHYTYTFPEKYCKYLRGKILSYNEIGEITTLFAEDVIELAITLQLKELRVVSKSGTYSLISPSLKWPTKDEIFDTFHSIDCDYDLLNTEFWEQRHICWEKAANKLGLKYQRFPPKPRLNVSCEETICE